ncbi:MAG: TMEM165/GDT1 family protein [Candidatus Omnitrophica bacterium]|nr:TMEM165/GDT1 family protein [Candidatus Omnitrophota bacterium]
MDWKIFFATFGTIFLAELGDKTQLANLFLAAKSGAWVSVCVASILAFALVTLLTVIIGTVASNMIKPEMIKYGTATLFIMVGVLMLFGKL